jgi:hypothetical protein
MATSIPPLNTSQRSSQRRFMLRDLVIADVSDEILKSRIGGDSLGATLNTVTNQDAKMCEWLNKWIVPLLVALITLVAISIAAFVGFGVHLLR